MKQQVVLIILDGWGVGRSDESNPIHVVRPAHIQWIEEHFPHATLEASGINVGLPWGEVGNSEVGHLTLGAGKVIYQYFPKITLAIRDKSFFKNPALIGAMEHARAQKGVVHAIGLLSGGNVHASIEHVQALVALAEQEAVPFQLHLFGDGKDSPPRSIEKFLEAIPRSRIATLIGRYYAMDREENWHLTQKAYEVLTGTRGELIALEELSRVLEATYRQDGSEEFLIPLRFAEATYIKDGDAVIFFNFREDSIRQLAESFILKDFDKFPVQRFRNLFIALMTQYEDRFHVPVAFLPDRINEPLGKVLAETGKRQLRLAETYKYAHVTYFFNGHREAPYLNEYRALIPSQHTLHAEEHPEMMAKAISDRLIDAIENQSFDVVVANYANADTIAHTGNYDAALLAVRVLDEELARITKSVLTHPTILLVTSDHGNIEEIINPLSGSIETQHDPNPVPLYVVGSEFKGRSFLRSSNSRESLGMLSDVAPTVLSLLGIPQPKEMTGYDLIRQLQ